MHRQRQLKRTIQFLLALSIFLPVLIRAEQKADLNGRWKCVVRGLGADELEATLALNQVDKKVTGTITVNGNSFPLSEVTLENDAFQFTVITEEHKYASTATLIEGKLVGRWKDESGNEGNWEAQRESIEN